LESLQHDLVAPPPGAAGEDNDDTRRRREYTVRHYYPNGNLFSGNVDADTGSPVYGRMTYALEMEVYEGPFDKLGERHGRGATLMKVDGSAKFLGRYKGGAMHSGTLIVAPTTTSSSHHAGGGAAGGGGGGEGGGHAYTGTFVGNDFHGIGTMVSGDGSIYQGRFANGQYHGVGTLRTAVEEEVNGGGIEEGGGDDEDGEDDDDDAWGVGTGKGGDGDKRRRKRRTRRRWRRKECSYVGDFVEGAFFHGHGTRTC
jgi:hypothetical protein